MTDYKKLYEDAIFRMNKWIEGSEIIDPKEVAEFVFPELKESLDEKIRKTLIRIFKKADMGGKIFGEDITYKQVVACLEKRGENHIVENNEMVKPADKIEPKFKICDWVVHDMSDGRKVIRQIIGMTNKSYILDCEDFNTFYFNDLENDYHLWTVEDAEDGDVLKSGSCILIFKEIKDDWIYCYCSHHHDGSFIPEIYNLMTIKYSNEVYPATLEECEKLEKVTKEMGYEWDADKKELKKIEQEETELPKGEDYAIDGLWQAIQILEHSLGEVDGWQSDDGILEHKCAIEEVKRLYKPNSTWSEEDENLYTLCESAITTRYNDGLFTTSEYKQTKLWLKSLKNRVQLQTQQEWGEDDKEQLDRALYMMEQFNMTKSWDDVYNWLKSLKDRI